MDQNSENQPNIPGYPPVPPTAEASAEVGGPLPTQQSMAVETPSAQAAQQTPVENPTRRGIFSKLNLFPFARGKMGAATNTPQASEGVPNTASMAGMQPAEATPGLAAAPGGVAGMPEGPLGGTAEAGIGATPASDSSTVDSAAQPADSGSSQGVDIARADVADPVTVADTGHEMTAAVTPPPAEAAAQEGLAPLGGPAPVEANATAMSGPAPVAETGSTDAAVTSGPSVMAEPSQPDITIGTQADAAPAPMAMATPAENPPAAQTENQMSAGLGMGVAGEPPAGAMPAVEAAPVVAADAPSVPGPEWKPPAAAESPGGIPSDMAHAEAVQAQNEITAAVGNLNVLSPSGTPPVAGPAPLAGGAGMGAMPGAQETVGVPSAVEPPSNLVQFPSAPTPEPAVAPSPLQKAA